MGILYDRHETDEHTIIRFSRYLGAMFVVVSAYLSLAVFVGNVYLALFVTLILVFVMSRDMRSIRSELIAANEEGKLVRSGRRISLRNPLTYYIAKRAPNAKRPQKGKRPPQKKR
jgi:predicted PurR-regulated permease PerM